ncbi:MAG: helix-turn-helix domain-containing protein [Silicimonas sp.]|nr:helix-turn-helix domain-containing protein [Silicimonas sp.]
METLIPTRLTTLGHPQRLAVFRLLMRRYPDRVPASELADALDLKANTLSTYVNALRGAGLITQERRGTSLLYGADLGAARETMDYLLLDCCRGRPEICTPNAPAPAKTRYNVLFLCTGNSARSIFAETLLRDMGGERFEVFSAGSQPKSELNPFAVAVLKSKGHDIAALRAKSMAEFQTGAAPRFDFVFTVCDQAANEDCPAWNGQPISAHWGLPDPARPGLTGAERALAFQETYGAIRNRIAAFTALPFDALDRMSLQKAVDDIGRLETGALQ